MRSVYYNEIQSIIITGLHGYIRKIIQAEIQARCRIFVSSSSCLYLLQKRQQLIFLTLYLVCQFILALSQSKPTAATSFAEVLREHHSDLRAFLNLDELIPLLRKQELLTSEEWENILGKQTRLQKIDQLIRILPQKGESAFLKFMKCLESEREHPAHKELAAMLKKTQTLKQQMRQPRKRLIHDQTTANDHATASATAAAELKVLYIWLY